MNKKKLRYAILKEIDNNNKNLTENDFKVTPGQFDDAINFLNRENYLKGIPYGDGRPLMWEKSSYLTDKGENYLEDNNLLAKSYKGLKEIRDWLKL